MAQLTERHKKPEVYSTGTFKQLMLTEPGVLTEINGPTEKSKSKTQGF